MDASVPPVVQGQFLYRDALFVDVGGEGKRHTRAYESELKDLLNGTAPKDQVAHWYEAQLIHYGLQRSKEKNTAKVRLQQALNQGKLKVPQEIAEMEARMKKEYAAAVRKAKAGDKAGGSETAVAKGTKKRRNHEAREESSKRTKVTVNVGGISIDIEQNAQQSAKKKQVASKGSASAATAAAFGPSATRTGKDTAISPSKPTASKAKAKISKVDDPNLPQASKSKGKGVSNAASSTPAGAGDALSRAATKQKAESKRNNESKSKLETKVKAEQVKVEPKVKAAPKIKTEGDGKGKAKADSKVTAEPRVKTESKLKAESKVKKEPKIKPEPKYKSEPKIKAEPQIEAEPKVTEESDFKDEYMDDVYMEDAYMDEDQPYQPQITGVYTITCPQLEEKYGEEAGNLRMQLCRDGDMTWGGFSLATKSGVMKIDGTAGDTELPLGWRARDDYGGPRFGRGCWGRIEFYYDSGERVRGSFFNMFPETVYFDGFRRPGPLFCGRRAHSLEEEWERFVTEAHGPR